MNKNLHLMILNHLRVTFNMTLRQLKVNNLQRNKRWKKFHMHHMYNVASISPDGVRQAPREHDMLWLHHAIAAEDQHWNSFHAVLDSDMEVLTMEFDLEFISNRNRKHFLHNPAAFFLVKKIRDTEVNFGKLSSEHQKLCTCTKAKEVSSFISNEAVRRYLDDAEIKLADDTGRILRARWVLTWKLVFPQDQASAEKDGKENASTVHTRDGHRKAKARIVLLGYEHPTLGEASYRTSSPVCSVLGRNLMYQVVCQRDWRLEGLELATAFLQTAPSSADSQLWTSGVAEHREALQVGPEGIMKLQRNIYGSTACDWICIKHYALLVPVLQWAKDAFGYGPVKLRKMKMAMPSSSA